MRPPRRPRPRPPSPAPAPAPFPSRDAASHSPPSPYAAAFVPSPGPSPGPGPGPAPEQSALAPVAGGGKRAGGSLSPPLIAMLAVVGAALLVVLYARLVSRVFRAARRRWRRRRLRLLMAPGGGPFSPSSARGGGGGGGDGSFASFTTYDNYYHTFSPYCGLDAAAIKSLPSAQYLAAARGSGASRECAVCLLEFADGDELRALPLCAHAFHADCIDVWLRAHASCPLCRTAVTLPPPVASPLHRTARRVRPSLDDLLLFHPVQPAPPDGAAPEIAPASPARDRAGPT